MVGLLFGWNSCLIDSLSHLAHHEVHSNPLTGFIYMTISAHYTGVNMLNQAQGMATTAAKDIQQSSLGAQKSVEQASEVKGSAPTGINNPIDASIDLIQAQTYNQAGANVIRRADEMTGTLLNMKV